MLNQVMAMLLRLMPPNLLPRLLNGRRHGLEVDYRYMAPYSES